MRSAVVYKSPEILARVEKILLELGHEVESFNKPSKSLESFDFIVSIGGDGTILSILQEVRNCPPIFGINSGKIGFLTHSNTTDFEEKLIKAIKEFKTEKFDRIKCSCENAECLALNEIAFLGRERAKLTEISIKIDSIEVDKIRCDGVIVATQIGSTAYSFSAGGPVVEPYHASMIIVPVAPFRFGWKPIVIGIDRVVELEAKSGGVAVVDGKRTFEAEKVRITKSEFPAVFFKREDRIKHLFYIMKKIE
ncbi:MAG: NAD(+)/NADH kinase [Archaeoglobaceae archaeon]|nr:NAD(+)/NADH kinase [Archaeoglobaceae archaeon]MDW8128492.1 NAD(+)/NADH kinase [Archaeoglobaceae archaeon]